ncbi:MAG: hypothetical protein ACAH17_03360 [Candidatus Paceibacterota bacterium]
MILAFDRSSMPLKARQIRDAIQHVFKVKVSATWISEFKQRHKKYLRTRTTKGIQTRRLKTTSPAEVKDWLDRLDLFLKRHHFPAKARFNIDETRVIPAMKQKYLVGAPGMNDLNKSNVRAGRIECYGTCLPFISADGDVFMVSYVLKSKQETYFHEVIPALCVFEMVGRTSTPSQSRDFSTRRYFKTPSFSLKRNGTSRTQGWTASSSSTTARSTDPTILWSRTLMPTLS